MGKVEEVARALCASDGENWDARTYNETSHGCDPEEQRDYWREKARVAIEAMREPSIAMRHVATFQAAEIDWPAMIDAALSEDKEQG